jgi:signal transduction histidine kinase
MDINERLQCLKGIDLFASFVEKDLQKFAENLTTVKLQPGEILFVEGDPGHDMFILMEGALRIVKNGRTITVTEAVDYVGEMAIIEEKPRSATVEAIDPCTLLKITYNDFENLFARQPASLVSLMKSLSRKIRVDTERIANDLKRVSILVHDMKNLLTNFLLFEVLIREIPEGSRAHRHLTTMLESSRHLATMMDEALAQDKNRHQPYPVSSNSLPELLLDLSESEFCLHSDIKDKNIKISINKTLPDFQFNKLDIRRVLANLTLNAAQASKAGDTIEIEADQCEDAIIIKVKDHGTGIPRRLLNRIFQAHFTTKSNGNGLGLASCKQIIEEKHHGQLACTSTPDEGTVFTVTLPLERAAALPEPVFS